jgi:cell fate (sporulation/competence/biofilm development) regulator YlbF (YheA/YmcA/DUF963 family)
MPTNTQSILDAAEKIGDMLKDHPAVVKYMAAQKTVSEDADASRLLREFDRQLENLGRQEQSGLPVSEQQQQQIQSLQNQIISHIKIKALNLAQVEFVDLLRKVSQAYQSRLVDAPPPGSTPGGQAGAPAASGPRIIQ